MPVSTKEIAFEQTIESYLLDNHQYLKRIPMNYDKIFCIDSELLFQFLQATQGKAFAKLQDQHGDLLGQKFLKRLYDEIKTRGTLDVLRNGIKDSGVTLDLAYFKPASGLNPETEEFYSKNVLSEIRQLKYSTKNENSIDTVLFLNGLPIFTVELKNQLSGQNIEHAIRQYKSDRDENEPLLQFKRCLVHWAVDADQAFMASKLAWPKTYFLPFNKGNDLGAGNPVNPKGYKTAYLREDIRSKDSIMELIANYVCLVKEESKDPQGKRIETEKLIFPRYHQYDVVRQILADVKTVGTGKNYLIQHSAWSGKSNSIAWLAHHLAEIHSEKNKAIFDSVIVITDRRVLDRQLQTTISQFAKVKWVVNCITDGSKNLKEALQEGSKIIITTLQKFPFILADIGELNGKNFAVIVDEAHSSQSGESVKSLKQVLTVDTLEDLDIAEKFDGEGVEIQEDDLVDETVEKEMKARWRLQNVSFFAFTATPKNKTLELFGEKQFDGTFQAFHLYSMRQAIQEKFILDTLKNYTTYKTYFSLLKKIEQDPEYAKTKAIKIARKYVDLHQFTIEKRVEMMASHFLEQIKHQIWGKAKAMVVTKSRLHAVRYKLAFDKYLADNGYTNIKALVAFSGTVEDKEFGQSYTESGMNGIPEKNTAEEFKKPEYRFMIVAEKFQTGFDQPLLCAMYVDKQLTGIAAVQTLSRLNRIHPEKQETFVLDFINEPEVIQKSFEPYYKTTILSGSTDPNLLYGLERKIMEYKLFYNEDINQLVKTFFNREGTPEQLNSLLDPVIASFKELEEDKQKEFKDLCNDYTKLYAFLSQIITFTDTDLEKLYIYVRLLKKKFPYTREELPVEIVEQISTESFKIVEVSKGNIQLEEEEIDWLDPLQTSGGGKAKVEELDYLSNILNDINKRFGTAFTEADKVILNNLYKNLANRDDIKWYMLNKENSKEDVARKFGDLFTNELVRMVSDHQSVHEKIDKDNDIKDYIKTKMFEHMYKSLVDNTNRI